MNMFSCNKKYKYEHEMCEDFINNIKDKWDIYPEFGSWDMLLVNKETGIQVGVQAKLKQNVQVIYQAARCITNAFGHYLKCVPDYAAVLTPDVGEAFYTICKLCNIVAMRPRVDPECVIPKYSRISHENRYELPEIKMNSKCGVSSPRSLSKWRINVLKLMIIYQEKGYVTSKDMSGLGLHQTTMTNIYFSNSGEREGKLAKYKLTTEKSPVDNYEKEFEQLKLINKVSK